MAKPSTARRKAVTKTSTRGVVGSRAPRPTSPSARVVGLLGAPFDANSSFKRGPARAPQAIRAALGSDSANAYSERGVKVWPSDHVLDLGDLEIEPVAGVREPLDVIERGVSQALERAERLLILGGDHAVTYPVLRAFAARFGKLSMLHFDAHPDLYPDFEGNRYSHACPMARILEEGLVERLVQVGIRSYTPAQTDAARRFGVKTFPAWNLAGAERLVFSTPVYVSIDLDGVDPAFTPGVSHPEPGGMTVRQVLDVIAGVKAPFIAGGDVVELNPECDSNGLSAAVAAKFARELLGRLS